MFIVKMIIIIIKIFSTWKAFSRFWVLASVLTGESNLEFKPGHAKSEKPRGNDPEVETPLALISTRLE